MEKRVKWWQFQKNTCYGPKSVCTSELLCSLMYWYKHSRFVSIVLMNDDLSAFTLGQRRLIESFISLREIHWFGWESIQPHSCNLLHVKAFNMRSTLFCVCWFFMLKQLLIHASTKSCDAFRILWPVFLFYSSTICLSSSFLVSIWVFYRWWSHQKCQEMLPSIICLMTLTSPSTRKRMKILTNWRTLLAQFAFAIRCHWSLKFPSMILNL